MNAVQYSKGEFEVAKTAEPTITYSMDSAITVGVKPLRTESWLGEGKDSAHTTWAYDIQVGGRSVFKGNNLHTYGKNYMSAALDCLILFMREDVIRDYDPEVKGGRGNWMFNVVPRYRKAWMEASSLLALPGVMVANGDGTFKPLLDPDVPEVTLSSEIPDVPMDIVDPENETLVTYPNIENSLFSN